MNALLIGIGFVIGLAITMFAFRFFIMGTLRIIEEDPREGPYLFLELSKDMRHVVSKKYVIFKVSRK